MNKAEVMPAINAVESSDVVELVKINRDILFKILSHMNSVAEHSHVSKMVSFIKVEGGRDGMKFTATDMDLQVTESVDIKCAVQFSIAISSQIFFDIVRKMPLASEISISKLKNVQRVFVCGGSSKFDITYLDADTFPQMSNDGEIVNFNMNGSDLSGLLRKVKNAMALDDARYCLNGVYFNIVSGKLVVVATDGHRLSMSSVINEQLSDKLIDHGVIVPRKTILELIKLLVDDKTEVSVCISNGKICFQYENIILVSKLVNGDFPNYEDVIPKDYEVIIKCDRKQFAMSVDHVSSILYEKTKMVKYHVNGNSSQFHADSSEHGRATSSMEVENEGGKSISVAFNVKYVLDAVSSITGGTMQFCCKGSCDPILMLDASDKDGLHKHIVMPMRI